MIIGKRKVLLVMNLSHGYEAVEEGTGLAQIDADGVAVRGFIVVAFHHRGLTCGGSSRKKDKLIGIVALLEQHPFGVRFVSGLPFHLASFVQAPIRQVTDDMNGAVDAGVVHRQTEIYPGVVGFCLRVVAVPDVDLHATVQSFDKGVVFA